MDTGAQVEGSTYRLKPSLWSGFIVLVIYMAIVMGIQIGSGVEYTEITKSSENLLRGVLIPVASSSIFLTIFALWSGWWKDVFKDKFKIQGHNWMYLLVVFAVIGTVVNFVAGDIGSLNTSFIAYAAIATALVGYSEELMTRGLLLRGARGSGFSEIKVFLITSLAFGLMHSLNILNGQDVKTTLLQVMSTFMAGGVYYAIFRKTGFLWVTMVLHALWDFSLLTNGADTVNKSPTELSGVLILATLCTYASYIVLFASIRFFNVKGNEKISEAEPA
ncbi:Abortive infection protein [sediment metagenome]|uniref:Abortive infection protein n=1 Tax=sediment metagenome TaxID=749907 RepID=D9PLB3_9ZZZZ